MTDTDRKTCQICGRAIKAKNGTIAHHGFKRPRGWYGQTASCPGAKHLPFEVDSKVLASWVERLLAREAALLEMLQDVQAGRKPVMTRGDTYRGKLPREVDPGERWYLRLKDDHLARIKWDLRGVRHEVVEQTKRLQHWSPTE
jgi:hypothetical protein